MQILKRSSGGRGEYEIAGTYGSLSPTSLDGFEVAINCGPHYAWILTGIELKVQGGKRRLRKKVGSKQVHIHRQIEVILLMPKSIRDERHLPGGEPVLLENRYVLRSIDLQSVHRSKQKAMATLGKIDCDNGSRVEELDFDKRLEEIHSLHEHAQEFPPRIGKLLERHRQILGGDAIINSGAEKIVTELMSELEETCADYDREYVFGTDPVPALAELINLPKVERPPEIAQIDPQDVELRRREGSKWRQFVAARGAVGVRFRKDVRDAYGFKCVVCGLHFPRSKACRIAGVDAAHILPWAAYDLDVVANGLCLCKLHHWAFDQLLIAILPSTNGYKVQVTQIAREAFAGQPETLAKFEVLEGDIPNERLPSDAKHLPGKQFLLKLYEDMALKEV